MLIVQEYLTRVAFYGLVAGPWLATNTQRKSVRKNNNPRIFLYTLLLFLSFFLLDYFTFVLNFILYGFRRRGGAVWAPLLWVNKPGSIGGDPFLDWSPYNITSLLKDPCVPMKIVSHAPDTYKTFAYKSVQSILESV